MSSVGIHGLWNLLSGDYPKGMFMGESDFVGESDVVGENDEDVWLTDDPVEIRLDALKLAVQTARFANVNEVQVLEIAEKYFGWLVHGVIPGVEET